MSFDVSISFATPDQPIAEEIHNRLKSKGVKSYYYLHSPEETLGNDLRIKLEELYSQSNIVLVINSKDYLTPYTKIELDAALNGISQESGIIPVKVDDYPFPNELEGRTYWDLESGTDALIDSILKMLKKRSLKNPAALLGALLFSTALVIYLILGLGFNDFNRSLDILVLCGSLLPILWFVIFRLVPLLLMRRKIKRLKGDNLLQSPPLRALEFLETYLRNIVVLGIVALLIFSTYQRNKIIRMENELINFSSNFHNLSMDQNAILKDISNTITKASTRILPSDLGESINDSVEYQSLVDSLVLINLEIKGVLEAQQINLNDSLIYDYFKGITQNKRILDSYIGHQISELSKDKSNLGYNSWLERRKQLTQTLISYNKLFTENIFELERNSPPIQLDTEKLLSRHRNRWKGVI